MTSPTSTWLRSILASGRTTSVPASVSSSVQTVSSTRASGSRTGSTVMAPRLSATGRARRANIKTTFWCRPDAGQSCSFYERTSSKTESRMLSLQLTELRKSRSRRQTLPFPGAYDTTVNDCLYWMSYCSLADLSFHCFVTLAASRLRYNIGRF